MKVPYPLVIDYSHTTNNNATNRSGSIFAGDGARYSLVKKSVPIGVESAISMPFWKL